MVIGIDGPSGSGKGTISKLLSEKCGLTYVDTGATYRAVALEVLRRNIDINDTESIIEIASLASITFDGVKTFLNGVDVSNDIRKKEVDSIVPKVSSIPLVREYMVKLQRSMAKTKDVVMEGRDITTIVLPDADYKFYLDASIDVRAKRRYEQNIARGIDSNLEEIKDAIIKRDYDDMHKEVGSLMRTEEQIYIDSSNMTIDEVVDEIRKVIGR